MRKTPPRRASRSSSGILLILLILMLGVAWLAPMPSKEPDLVRPEATAMLAVVRLDVVSGPWTGGHGSGTPLACVPASWGRPGYDVFVLTAAHVADAGQLQGLDGALCNSWTVWEDTTRDLAVVALWSADPVPVVSMRAEPLQLGEDVWASGYGGYTGNLWVSRGVFSGDRRMTAAIIFGDSGGAVLDTQGRLVGVVSALEAIRNPWGVPEALSHHAYFAPVTGLVDQILAEIKSKTN